MDSFEKFISKIPVKDTKFVRVHERYIVSLVEVEFDKNITEAYIGSEIIPISKARRKKLLESLEIL